MRFLSCEPPRKFDVGQNKQISMHDCGRLQLEPNEQVTLTTPSGGEYDVARKDFGFYATPSVNSRLTRFGLRAVLVRNPVDHFYVLLVEAGKEGLFDRYCAEEKMSVVSWLDETEKLVAFAEKITTP